MGFRFRKALTLFPGAKLNLTKRGISSLSLGKRGATVNMGKQGVSGTVGIPGSGLSFRTDKSTSKWLVFLVFVAIIVILIVGRA